MLFDDARLQMVTRARSVEYCAPTENYKQQIVTRARPTNEGDDAYNPEITMKKKCEDEEVKKRSVFVDFSPPRTRRSFNSSDPQLSSIPLQPRPINHDDQTKERRIREQLLAEELLRSKNLSTGNTNTATQRVSVRDRLEARAMLRSNVHETIQSTPKDELLLRAMNRSENPFMKEVAMGCLIRFLKEEAFDDGESSARELASLQQFYKKNRRFEAAVSCGEKLLEVKEKIHVGKIEALHQEHDRQMTELHSEINDLRRRP